MARRFRQTTTLTALGLLAVGPFAVVQGFLFLEHKSPWHSQEAEMIFLATGIATGCLGVWLLPIKRRDRGLLTVPYVLLMVVATWFSILPAVCGYFGDCM